jgi:hypothetical protein
VDCHAFGENVVTAGDGSLAGTTPNNRYTNTFGGTSAAAAIVAGAVVVIQGMHRGVRGVPLTATEMRQVLRTSGTPQGFGVPGLVGRMPDLKKAAIALSLVPSGPAAPTNVRITT